MACCPALGLRPGFFRPPPAVGAARGAGDGDPGGELGRGRFDGRPPEVVVLMHPPALMALAASKTPSLNFSSAFTTARPVDLR